MFKYYIFLCTFKQIYILFNIDLFKVKHLLLQTFDTPCLNPTSFLSENCNTTLLSILAKEKQPNLLCS